MSELEKRIENIKEDLSFFDTELEKYEYIIDLGKKLEDIDEVLKSDENKVEGCTSLVWLVSEIRDEKIYFKGTSDALIVKGLVYLILKIFSDVKKEEIVSFDINLLESLELSEIITPTRQSGVAGMVAKIVEYARG
jgi:cysteine desulfuration protein SufE